MSMVQGTRAGGIDESVHAYSLADLFPMPVFSSSPSYRYHPSPCLPGLVTPVAGEKYPANDLPGIATHEFLFPAIFQGRGLHSVPTVCLADENRNTNGWRQIAGQGF